jgi:hypothetical protein
MNKQIDELMALVYDYAALRINWESGNTNQTTPHLVDAAEKKLRTTLDAVLGQPQVVHTCFKDQEGGAV